MSHESSALDEHVPALSCSTVRFAHATNTRAKVLAALRSPDVNFLEADVITTRGCEGGAPVPVMGHDPGSPHDLTFAEFIELVAGTGKGVKVDIKEWAAVAGVLEVLKAKEASADEGGRPWPLMRFQHQGLGHFDRPALFVNADVLPGFGVSIIPEDAAPPPQPPHLRKPGCRFNPHGRIIPLVEQIFAARTFIEAVLAAVPAATLSLGWCTGGEHGYYTPENVQDMLFVVGDRPRTGVGITYAVRASYVLHSLTPQRLLRLLGSEADEDASPARHFPAHGGSTFTLWSNAALSASDDAFLRSGGGGALPLERMMFDMVPPAAEAPTQGGRGWKVKALTAAVGLTGLALAVAVAAKLARRR